ncbi:MAG: TetR/AcrR family transcriptional regulator [Candidatus Binatia bacterium]|nr:TetR/AcrR family transcriptional regulator [Candidatus Binatia bacterium]MDG1960480.1 TetR/AcrR family transcriptional regulator [Candidatus Binatia bacterium]MDG2009523.1 TetR/AcrR family transcriptional regulator [Candidatus Binatia bacterium]HAC81231.1 TetR/AcrR family transcriptional regulator [Deltaproteobacteria bacterium]
MAPAKSNSGKDTRVKILNAAEELILEAGSSGLVLDEVARRAGVSKGGLLYHFGSKAELVSGLLERRIAYYDEITDPQKTSGDESPGSSTRAYLDSAVSDDGRPADKSAQLLATLLATFGSEPQVLDPLREAFARWQQEIETDAIDPVEATIVRLAADGLWLTQLLGLTPLSQELAVEVVRKLKERTR